MSDFIDHERPYPWPADAAHAVPAMLCLEYKDKPRQRKWRVACRMHVAGLNNMLTQAHEEVASGNWTEFRIVKGGAVMYQTTDWKGRPVWKLENGDRVNPDLYVDVTDAKPLPGLKRDRVYGMCAEHRRAHCAADKRRWHVPMDGPYGPRKYSFQAHLAAYAKALGLSPEQAEARVITHREHLEAHPQVIDNSSMLGAR